MRKKFAYLALFYAALLALALAVFAEAAGKTQILEGIITQINLGDNSFDLRLRDGRIVKVQNPTAVDTFVSVKGILEGGVVSGVTEIKTKNANGADAIPRITEVGPSAGQVGDRIIVTGTGFLKKGNTVSFGNVKNFMADVPSRDGKTLTFQLPPRLCDQRFKKDCPAEVIPPGEYDLAVTNKNGLSNPVSFRVMPLPPLTITTEILPQVSTRDKYRANISAVWGAERYAWKISAGNLPPGLWLYHAACKAEPCRNSALIAGIPTAAGEYNFTLTLASGLETVSREFRLKVVEALNQPY